MEEMPENQAVSFCPSFSFYSSGRCDEIAAKFADEKKPLETLTDTEDDPEFTFVLGDWDLIADEISREGQIHQFSPIFNRDLPVINNLARSDCEKSTGLSLRLPLEKLFADELESVPAGAYSVWRPKVKLVDSPSRDKKCSSSSGSALKQWKLRDLLLLRRSRSEGKEDSFETTKARKTKAKKKVSLFRITKCFKDGIDRTCVNVPNKADLC